MLTYKATARTLLPALAGLSLMPLGLWLVLPRFGAGALALLGLMVLGWQALATRQWRRYGALALVIIAVALLGHADVGMRAWPVIVNGVLGSLFAGSLRPHHVPLIERLARRNEPELPPAGVRYTRRVTWLWLSFFTVNALIALATALWASQSIWVLYNGGISYVLCGLLMVGEWCVRQRVRSRHADPDGAARSMRS